MASKITLIIFLCCIAAGGTGCKKNSSPVEASAEKQIINNYDRGPLHVSVKLSSEQIRLSDLLGVELSAEIDSGYSVDFSGLSGNLEGLAIREDQPPVKKLGSGNKTVYLWRCQLEPLVPGECKISELQFTYQKEGQGKDVQSQAVLETKPIVIQVTTSVQGDVKDKSISDIEDVVDVPANYLWLMATAGTIVFIVVGLLFWRHFRPKKTAEIRRIYKPAHELAMDMLRQLANEKLVEQGRIKEFYEKLSGCLRQYIENRFRLRAPEQTTEEFLEDLKNSEVLEPEYKQELKQFLEQCDLVKFAKYRPENEQINDSLAMAERFVDKTKSEDSQIEMS